MRGQDDPTPPRCLLGDSAASLLTSLRGLRSAPALSEAQLQQLRSELGTALAGCRWFTVGVMAPDRPRAVQCLRSLESALGWPPLRQEEGRDADDSPKGGPVFLKGNQSSGIFRLRQESGLGEGLLITGHNPEAPEQEDTWGPLPLQLFG